MISLVIDTSVAVKWLNQDNEANAGEADKILVDAKNNHVKLFAPELLKYEVGNELLFGKKISTRDIRDLMNIFYSLPITFIAANPDLASYTYVLAKNLEMTYYDASFLSLAKQYNATLVTENIKHQGKTSEVKVIPLAKYK